MQKKFYKLYDLNIASEFELLNLQNCAIPTTKNIDVILEKGITTVPFDKITFEADFDPLIYKVGIINNQIATLLIYKKVGRYLIIGGQKIIADCTNGIYLDFHSYLNSLAFTSLLFQKGLFVLHAAAIVTAQGAVLLMGNSGAGKTTTMAAFLKKGYSVLSEDTVVIRRSKENYEVLPSIPYFKLMKNTADFLGYNWQRLPLLYADAYKKAVFLGKKYQKTPVSLSKIYLLKPDNQTSLLDFQPMDDFQQKFETLAFNINYPQLFEGYDLDEHYTSMAIELAEQIPFYEVKRPTKGNTLDELTQLIEADFLNRLSHNYV